MQKIFINEVPLILCDESEAENFSPSKTLLKGRYLNIKSLHSYIDMMEKPHQFETVVMFSDDLEKLKKTFKQLFKAIAAAGGVVRNQEGRILFIFRRGFWDLPKGKIDEGEKKKQAAVREVQEETGIQNIELQEKICKTYHTYTQNGQRILKTTHWYNMITSDMTLVPQTEEDIEQAIWMSKEEFFAEKRNVYKSIVMVLKKA